MANGNRKKWPDRVEQEMLAVENLLALMDKRISEFEGKALIFTENKCYSRCLSFQASMAKLLALENGWITKEELSSPGGYSEMDEEKRKQLESWLKNINDSFNKD